MNPPAELLQIAGLVPFSTVDWPGKLVATVFCQGCPWRCEYCQNSAILSCKTPGQVPYQELKLLLEQRRGLLDGVVFSGGEALTQLALMSAVAETKQSGFQVGLHNAGAYPRRFQELLDSGHLDWVGQDIKALPENYSQVTGSARGGVNAWKCLDILLASGVAYEVRLTVYPNGPRDCLEVAERLVARGVTHFALQVARSRGTKPGFRAAIPGWDEQVALWDKKLTDYPFLSYTFRK